VKVTGLLTGQPFMTQYGIAGYSTVVLLEDDGRRIVFDCGSRGCSVQLKDALGRAGMLPSDITDVVISHLHFDHVGNLPLFTNARILLGEQEWHSACNSPDEYHDLAACAYIRESGRLAFIKEGDRLTSHIEVLSLPGHTCGLLGLRCGDDTVLCSDAIKNRYELWEGLEPMSVDRQQSLRTMDKIRHTARYIYPGHDCMLDLAQREATPIVSVRVRFANGNISEAACQ